MLVVCANVTYRSEESRDAAQSVWIRWNSLVDHISLNGEISVLTRFHFETKCHKIQRVNPCVDRCYIICKYNVQL